MKTVKALSVLAVFGLTACGTQPPAPVVSGYEGQGGTSYSENRYATAEEMVESALDEFTVSYAQEPAFKPVEAKTYKVQRGDSVESIARAHGVSEESLRVENSLSKTEILAIGREVSIPQLRAPSLQQEYRLTQNMETSSPVIERPIVEAEENTLENEALAAASSVLGSVKSKPEAEKSAPVAQKKVKATVSKVETAPATQHTVKSGENIFRIGLKYGVSQFDIMAANEIAKPEALKVGQVLNIPAKGSVNLNEIAPAAGKLEKPKGPQFISSKTRQKGLVWPAEGKVIKRFGKAGEGVNNTGINILLPKNSPIVAVEDGQVIYSDSGLQSYGNLILIRHKSGLVTAYAHNDRNMVKRNEKVRKGQVIAFAGDTGNVNQTQLHFEVRKNSQAINPMSVLPKM